MSKKMYEYRHSLYISSSKEVEKFGHVQNAQDLCNVVDIRAIKLLKKDFSLVPQEQQDSIPINLLGSYKGSNVKLASYSPIFLYTETLSPEICKYFYTCMPPTKGIKGFNKLF